MFWNVLDQHRQTLLETLVQNMPLNNSYLAGGTALALMLGHRQSIDFDWFTPTEFDPSNIKQKLSQLGNLEVSLDWTEVKSYFIQTQKSLLNQISEDYQAYSWDD